MSTATNAPPSLTPTILPTATRVVTMGKTGHPTASEDIHRSLAWLLVGAVVIVTGAIVLTLYERRRR